MKIYVKKSITQDLKLRKNIIKAKKEIFDELDNYIGVLFVAKDKNGNPKVIVPEWYRDIKERHLKTNKNNEGI